MNIFETRDVIVNFRGYVRGRILDFGAGSSKYKDVVAPLGDSYTAFDAVASPNIDVVGDVTKPSFIDASFDTIICTQVLEHVPDPERVVGHIARMLAPGGIGIITAPFAFPYHADPDDYFRYSISGLCALAQRAGLSVVERGRIGSIFSVLSETYRFAVANPYSPKKPEKIVRWTVKLVAHISRLLDRHIRASTMYAGAYIVARKD